MADILASDEVFDPLTRLQCCAHTRGAAAAILCSDAFARKHGTGQPVYLDAQDVNVVELHDCFRANELLS